MEPTLFWIKGPWAGRLAIAARPRGGDWLDDEIAAWKNAGVDTVISTLEPEEAREFELHAEKDAALHGGIDFVGLPIPDRQTPPVSAEEELPELEQRLRQGRNVIVHCRQGIGRSAVVAAALLILGGVEAEKAVRLVQDARLRPVPETEEQKEWIRRFAKDRARREAKV
jgi:protein-tyrosine phosphatase